MIQIDMPMPTNCFDCPACNEYLICAIPIKGRKWGENDVHEFCQGRPEWCPMKEQEPVVLCKDCKYSHRTYDGMIKFCDLIKDENDMMIELYRPGDWYCADGERSE